MADETTAVRPALLDCDGDLWYPTVGYALPGHGNILRRRQVEMTWGPVVEVELDDAGRALPPTPAAGDTAEADRG